METVESILNRIEPGNLWVHIFKPGEGRLRVEREIYQTAEKLRRDIVVCSYEATAEECFPDGIANARVTMQKEFAKPSKFPFFFELGTMVIPSTRCSNRTILLVDCARLCEALTDLDDWKALAKDIRHPMMISWQLARDEDPDDFDFGEADFVTRGFFDPESEDKTIVVREVQ